jgi:hypothetical protein
MPVFARSTQMETATADTARSPDKRLPNSRMSSPSTPGYNPLHSKRSGDSLSDQPHKKTGAVYGAPSVSWGSNTFHSTDPPKKLHTGSEQPEVLEVKKPAVYDPIPIRQQIQCNNLARIACVSTNLDNHNFLENPAMFLRIEPHSPESLFSPTPRGDIQKDLENTKKVLLDYSTWNYTLHIELYERLKETKKI